MITTSTKRKVTNAAGGKVVEYLTADGERHRVDGPAHIGYDVGGKVKFEEFYVDGRYHRVDGPARLSYYTDGQVKLEEFCVDGKLHRVDGPADVWYYGGGQVEVEVFYVDGKLHRMNGPAYIQYSEDEQVEYEEFYLDGVELTSKEFLYKTYIDKLADPVSREQAIQLAEQAGWKITVEQLKAAVGLTLEEKPAVKLGSAVKTNSIVCKLPGV